MDFIVFVIVIFALVVVFIVEHKQKMANLEFEEKVYRMRQQFFDAHKAGEKKESKTYGNPEK